MAYPGHNWVNDTTPAINAANLNELEDEVIRLGTDVEDTKGSVRNCSLITRSAFTVAPQTAHSSKKDMILVNIRSGETFLVINNYGSIYIFYEDGTSTSQSGAGTKTITAEKNIIAIGNYVNNTSSGNRYAEFQVYVGIGIDLYGHSDLINRINDDAEINNQFKRTFLIDSGLQIGGLNTNGTLKPSQTTRVSSTKKVSYPIDIVVSVKSGYRWGYIPFVGDVADSWTGWFRNSVVIPAGTVFVAQISRYPEGSVDADVLEFANAITFDSAYQVELPDKVTKIENEIKYVDDLFKYQLGYTWYLNASQKLRKSDAAPATPMCNIGDESIEAGTILSCDEGYSYKYYIEKDGVWLRTDGTWISGDNTVALFGKIYLSVRKDGGSTTETIESLLQHFRIIIPINMVTKQNAEAILNIGEEKYDYSYDGKIIETKRGQYGFENTEIFTMPASDITVAEVTAIQGFGIDNGVIFQFYSDNALLLIDMATKEYIAELSVAVGHGNAIQFLNDKYDDSDDYHKAIVCDDTDRFFEVRIQNTGATILKTFVLPRERCGYYMSTCVDADNMILYSIGYTKNSHTTDIDNENYMIFGKWDLTDLTDNGDNTYTPAFIESFTTKFMKTYQGPTYFNGNIFVFSSHYEDTDTILYVVNPEKKKIMNTLSEFPSAIKNYETEAIYFYVENGKNRALVKTNKSAVPYIYMNFNS